MDINTVGRYRLLSLLGQGGMGQVYLARDPDLNRDVALKLVVLPGSESDLTRQQRFKREVQASARLSHPHIITLYDVGLEHQPPYVVMELLTGGTLRDRLQAKRLPWPQTLRLLRPLGLALSYAHRAGVIHRDLKPANIMFTGDDVLKLVDFGLARWQTEAGQASPPGGEPLTHSGDVFGTPAYMSPEQARGEPVDGRTDLFALGIILFEAVTGQNPLAKGSSISTLLAALDETPLDLTPLTNLAPAEVIRLIERAVAKNRAERYPTGEALLADLDHCLGDWPGEPTSPAPLLNRRPSTPPSSTPTLHKTGKIELSPDIETVLRAMFSDYSKVVIEAEFGHGLSGGRVFRISPIKRGGDLPDLPVVVKVALLPLIQQEWQAYQTWVAGKLPGAARLESGVLTLPPGSRWDGLRYSLAGDDVFKVQSLQAYYDQAETGAENLVTLLERHLFPRLEKRWWLNRHTDFLPLQDDYDSLLPVNLLIKPRSETANGHPAQAITPEQLPEMGLKAGTPVELRGWVVTEVELERRQVTLNRPPNTAGPPASCRLRLVEVADPDAFRVGQVLDAYPGVIVETRHDLLMAAARQALGETLDLSAASLPLSPTSFAPLLPSATLPATLPNPLLAYPAFLDKHQEVNVSIIHGDLNLENILVRPDNYEVYLIDFVTVRQGHSLHDLLRLETEVVTKLIPPALAEAQLPPTAIYPLYRQLHLALRPDTPAALLTGLPPALHKPLAMLMAIRKMAQVCLFKPDEWPEYYQGLTLYLLGALKFKNLDHLATAPLPKQVAFWGAASAVELLRQPVQVLLEAPVAPVPRPRRRTPLVWLAAAGVGLLGLTLLGLMVGLVGWWTFRPPAATPTAFRSGEEIAVTNNFTPEVKIELAGTERIVPADLSQRLYAGDVISTRAGAWVFIVCQNGSVLKLAENKNAEVAAECYGQSRVAELVIQLGPALAEEQVSATRSSSGPTASTQRGAARGDQEKIPYLLNPRNTTIADTRPTFIWQPVAGASGYRLSLIPVEGEGWSRDTGPETTRLTYPPEAPPLAPGSVYKVELTTLDKPTAVDGSVLRLPPAAELAALAKDEASLQALPLAETGRSLMLAQLYRQRGFLAAALAQLEPLAAAQQPPSASLWQQVGDLYLEMELTDQAETTYQQALSAAAATDPAAQAAAHLGLARVALTFGETAPALDHLTAAETLYRQAGQTDLADQVAAEREKLK